MGLQDLPAHRLQRDEANGSFTARLVLFLGEHCISVREWGDEDGMQYGAQSS